MTDYKDLSKIDTTVAQHRKATDAGIRPVYGLDTETYQGDIFLIADSDGRYLDKDVSADTVLDFLFHKKYQNAVNVFYNLKFDAIVILKLLGKELERYLHTRELAFQHGDFRIKYIPKKCLTITKGHKSVSFYDIAQFFKTSLQQAYERNIGPMPEHFKGLKSARGEFSARFRRRHIRLLREYCINDCIMTKALGEKWLELYYQAAGFYPKRLLSSAYLASRAMIFRGIAFPRFAEVPLHTQVLAYRAFVGGRFEQTKRGVIGEARNYDINSAYPDKIAKLHDLTDGQWMQGNAIESGATMGFFKVVANVPDWKYLGPFPFKANANLVYPTGKFVTYVSIEELKACERKEWYEILDSWQFVPNDPNYHPYDEFVREYYAKKTELKERNDPLHIPFKEMLNSIYGKTAETMQLEKKRVMGTFFNPVIASHITGSTRAQIYRYIRNNGIEKDVAFIATDGISVTRDLGKGSKALGKFALKDYAQDVFCIQNGINRWNGNWKERGIGSEKGKTLDNYDIYQSGEGVYMKLKVERVTNLRSAIRQGKIAQIGVFKEEIRKVDFDGDRKRFWLGKINSLNEDQFNESSPLSLSVFTREQI
ncbi:DNA polymerase type B, organellar and viral [Candidatus Nitrososphaera evergladensis SR1]|uniref:DNA-directed DNA polymerase n=2 Tax=Nitrososphaera TaxID=497726 RepID=A0A075MQE7_9ARCH|nr:DNA polymerase type B, organellar and viral [Candidatus Nitrososphaera evergladensis SR1]